MRICYLNHDLKSNTGAGRFCLFLLKEIKAIFPEARVTVLTSEASSHQLEWPFIKPSKLGLIFSLPKIRRVIKRSDIVHALDGWPYGVVAIAAALGLKKRVIITAVGSGAVAPLYKFPRRFLMKWAYRRADVVTAVSNNTKREILKIVPDLKIKVINHGVDYNKYQLSNPPAGRAGIKYQNDPKIKNLRPYILSVGTLKPRKGYEYSIKAFAEVARDFPKLNYVIFGSDYTPGQGEYRRLKNIAAQSGVSDRVIFLAYDKNRGLSSQKLSDDKLADLYRQAELFILLPQDVNKDIEGFGLVFLEAAACGLPMVATQNTSAEDAVEDGRNGILVPPADYQGAAEAMAQILSDKNIWHSFSRGSLEFAKKMSWPKTASEYATLYKNIS